MRLNVDLKILQSKMKILPLKMMILGRPVVISATGVLTVAGEVAIVFVFKLMHLYLKW